MGGESDGPGGKHTQRFHISLASGMTIDDILADYEDLEREDILAVLGFAARLAHIKRLQPLAA